MNTVRKTFDELYDRLDKLDSRKTILYGLASCTILMMLLSFVCYQTERDNIVGYVLAATMCSMGVNFFGLLAIMYESYHLVYLFFVTNILFGIILDFIVMLSFGWFALVILIQITNCVMCHFHLRHMSQLVYHSDLETGFSAETK